MIANTGLNFKDNGTNFTSIWKIGPQDKISIVVAYDIHPEWVHVLCNVGAVKKYVPTIPIILLRLNNAVIGTKFSIEQNQNIVCSAEIPIENLTEENLKRRVTQIVKMVTRFYENVEKENLKLNST